MRTSARSSTSSRILEPEERFRAYLGRYPKDAEALWQVGETLFHHAPLKGRIAAEARPLFDQILEVEPSNYPAVIHLVRNAASEGRTEDLTDYYEMVKDTDDRFSLEVGSMLAFGADMPSRQDSMTARMESAPDTDVMHAIHDSACTVAIRSRARGWRAP